MENSEKIQNPQSDELILPRDEQQNNVPIEVIEGALNILDKEEEGENVSSIRPTYH